MKENQDVFTYLLGGKYFGVDLTNESICDCYSTFVWEPSIIKTNCIEAATEAACIILSVDETVKVRN